MGWFGQEVKVKPHIIEVPKIKKPIEMNPEIIASLASHPGFQHLLGVLEFEKAVLVEKLKTSYHEEIRDVLHLQAAIHWASWLESKLNVAVKKLEANAPRAMNSFEEEAHNAIISSFELVGE